MIRFAVLFMAMSSVVCECHARSNDATVITLKNHANMVVLKGETPPASIATSTSSKRHEKFSDEVDKSEKIPNFSDGDVVFEETGEGTASKYERRMDAELRAEEDALRKALAKSRVDIVSGYSDLLAQYGNKDTQAISQYLLALSAAAVISEKVAPPVCEMCKEGLTTCRVILRGKIRFKGKQDPSFSIHISEDFRRLYRQGDIVTFSVSLSKTAYLYILSADEEQNTSLVYPNETMRSNRLESGKKVSFPDTATGIALRAILPDNKNGATEVLHVIATTVPILTLESLKAESVGNFKLLSVGSLQEVMKKIGALDRDQWTMQVLPFQITR